MVEIVEKEFPIKIELKRTAELIKGSSESKFYLQQAKDIKEIKFSRISEVLSLKDAIAIRKIDFQPHHCYLNAFKVAAFIPDMEYCEGFLHLGINIEHAFNVYKGKYYIDPTVELCLQRDPTQEDPGLLKVFDFDLVKDLFIRNEMCASVYRYEFKKNNPKLRFHSDLS